MAEYSDKSKWKWCELGAHDVPKLWKAKPKACQKCWMNHLATNGAKPTGIVKKYKPIAPFSESELKRLARYRKARAESKKEHTGICDYPGCNSTDLTCHHGAGRVGDLIANKKYFKWLCVPHHQWAEANPEEAQALGLSFTRTDK